MALGGCAPLRRSAGGAAPLVLRPAPPLLGVHSGPDPVVSDADYYRLVPHLVDRFNATHAGVIIEPTNAYHPGPASVYWLTGISGWGSSSGAVTSLLDSALQAHNFDPGIVQAEALAGYRTPSGLTGLPVSQAPIAVRWRKDVFAAAGLSTPASDWTIADFQAACIELQKVVERGTVGGLQAVLYPPQSYVVGPYCCWGVLVDPAWWAAFALGYGGTVAKNGVFALDSRALEGLAVLVDIASRFGPRSPLPTTAYPDGFALALDFWGPPGGAEPATEAHMVPAVAPVLRYGPHWAWARIPRFPVRPVITTLTNGEGLTPVAGAPSDDRQLAEVVEALLWLYTPAAQRILQAWGAVPVLSDPKAQRRFWKAQAPDGQAVGDWANFIGYGPEWPGSVNRTLISAALMAAIADPSQLEPQVAAAVQRMNASLPR